MPVRRFPCQSDPELMFPVAEPGTPAYDRQVARGRALCAGCPALVACRDYAVDSGQDYGIWGGTTPEDRRVLRRRVAAVLRG